MRFRAPDKPNQMSESFLQPLDAEGCYIATAKKDGFRSMLVHKKGGSLEAWSRNNTRHDTKPDFDKSILDAFRDLRIPSDSILDGEWMRRRAGNSSGINNHAVWGVLRWDGQWLNTKSERDRWDMVLALPLTTEYQNKSKIYIPEFCEQGFVSFYSEMQKDETNEGIVLKHKKSTLILNISESKKNPMHIKIKWRQ